MYFWFPPEVRLYLAAPDPVPSLQGHIQYSHALSHPPAQDPTMDCQIQDYGRETNDFLSPVPSKRGLCLKARKE